MTPNRSRGKRGDLDADAPALSLRPPHRMILATSWLIISLFAAVVLASVIVRVPESIRCPCLLVPEGGADPIQSPRRSVIRQIRVKEGSIVSAGDELFVLNSEEAGDLDTQARTLNEDLLSLRANLRQSEINDTADLKIMDHEVDQAAEEVAFKEKTVSVEHDLEGRIEKLYKLGIYSETDLILRKLEVAGAEKDLVSAQRSRQELVLQRQKTADEQSQRRSDQQKEIRNAEIRKEALGGQLEDSQHGLMSVRAPYAGVVISMAENDPGSVVQNGQELCQLARADGKLKLRLMLTEAALDRIAVGQRLRFFATSFPYQRYGTISGTLSWISPSAVASRDGQQFVAVATLDHDSFRIGDGSVPLRAGMGGEARIVVGSRTLIEYALEPLRQLRENMGKPGP